MVRYRYDNDTDLHTESRSSVRALHPEGKRFRASRPEARHLEEPTARRSQIDLSGTPHHPLTKTPQSDDTLWVEGLSAALWGRRVMIGMLAFSSGL